ncbi:MAG TPA: hypothetical protein VFQ47_09270, partial [Nitrososphaera sp.]|nr:hypothetical protein [Nitrososphaera sp.]
MARIPMLPQFYVGEGVNSTSGQIYGQAIDFASVQPATTGQMVELVLESVSSSRELTERLQIDASASFKLGWGASAEFKLANSEAINSYYTYALVRVVVQNPPQVLRDPKLRQAAQDLLMQEGWEGFSAAYGWEYIQGIITGGSYYALIEVQTIDEKQQREVKAKLSGSFGPFKADASLEIGLQEATKNTTTRVIVYQSGGSGDPVETTLDAMIEQARNFPQIARDNPVTIAVFTADYRSTVPLPPGLPAPDSLPRRLQRDTLQDLGRQYVELRDYKRSLEFILEQQRLNDFDDFRDLDEEEIKAKRVEYRTSLDATATELDKIVVQAGKCAEDYRLCQTYVPSVQQLPLPRKGGELMNLKELEEKLAVLEQQLANRSTALEQQLTDLSTGRQSFNDIVLAGGRTLSSPGRMHISGEEILFLLNKAGVIVSKAWGGNGKLTVEGDIVLGGSQTLYSPGRMHISGEEILFLLNKAGVTVSKAWGGTGDLTVEGNIGTSGFSPTPVTPGWGGGIHTWDVEAEGTVWSRSKVQTGNR